MTETRRKHLVLLARVLSAFTVVSIVVGFWLSTKDQIPTDFGLLLAFGLFPVVGYFMATRRPDNALSWLMVGLGVAIGIGALLSSYAGYALNGGIGGPHLGLIAEAFDNPMWIPIVVPPVTFMLLLFPDGHLPSPRWKWFARILGASMAIMYLTIVLAPGRFGEETGPFADYRNPLGVEALRPVLSVAIVSIAMLPIGVIGSLLALIRRFRRSSGIERLQLRLLVTTASVVAILYTVALLISFAGSWGVNQPTWMTILQSVSVFSFGLIPIAIGVSVLRYHLFDIDVVINRALLYGTIAVVISAVYVGIVVGVGALVGSRGEPILSAAAAAIIAIAFQPLRIRAQRFADRMVYGERAAPYEVLSEFSERLGNTYANDRAPAPDGCARSRAGRARSGPMCGSGSGISSCRRRRGHTTPKRSGRSRPRTTTPATCRPRRCVSRSGIRASSSARCRSSNGPATRSRRPRRSSSATSPRRPGW